MENENKKGRRKKEIGYNSVFATRLRDLMEKNNTTQPQLAEAVGVSRQAVGQWQNGNTVPDILDFQKVADYYNVSADYLLGRSESRSNDKDLKDVADYLGISDLSAIFIQDITRKISANEWEKIVNAPDCDYCTLDKGFNSNSADICNWIIQNLFHEAHYTVGALLAQMYRMNKYPSIDVKLTRYEDVTLEYSDFAHLLINKFSDKCKYKIDDLLKACSKTGDIKYHSLYSSDWFRKKFVSSIEEYKKRLEWFDDFPF